MHCVTEWGPSGDKGGPTFHSPWELVSCQLGPLRQQWVLGALGNMTSQASGLHLAEDKKRAAVTFEAGTGAAGGVKAIGAGPAAPAQGRVQASWHWGDAAWTAGFPSGRGEGGSSESASHLSQGSQPTEGRSSARTGLSALTSLVLSVPPQAPRTGVPATQ